MDTEAPMSSAGIVTQSSTCQSVLSRGQPAIAQVSPVIVTSGFTEAQSEEIFLLSHEVQTLHGKLAQDFIQLSQQEALFCMEAEATTHEKLTQGCVGRSMDERDKASWQSDKVAWLQTNSLLFCHTLEYKRNMIQLVTRSQEAIQTLHECIWTVIHRAMEAAGKPVADSLEIALHLVDMLPTIPLQLTFNTVMAGLPGCTPDTPVCTLPLGTHQGAMTVLGKEILKGACSAEERAMDATWTLNVTDSGSIRVTMIGRG